MGDSTEKLSSILTMEFPGVEFRIKTSNGRQIVVSWWEEKIESVRVNQFILENSSLFYIDSKSTEFGEYGIVRSLVSYTYADSETSELGGNGL
jgi:hypothetical protein